jgi:hypothetical protein
MDYDEYKHKVLEIITKSTQITNESLAKDLVEMKAKEKHDQMVHNFNSFIKNSYKEYVNQGLRSENHLKRMMSEKDIKKKKIEEIQINKFMGKFCVLSDYNLCIARNFNDPDLEEMKVKKNRPIVL